MKASTRTGIKNAVSSDARGRNLALRVILVRSRSITFPCGLLTGGEVLGKRRISSSAVSPADYWRDFGFRRAGRHRLATRWRPMLALQQPA